MHQDTVHLLAGQKKLKDEYKDHGMLPKINKSDMAGTMEAMEEYSDHVKVLLGHHWHMLSGRPY